MWGGPILTPAFGDELAARDVLCISCGPGTSYDYFDKSGRPYLWGLGILPEQGQTHVVEYISKKLKDGNAEHAGDPALHEPAPQVRPDLPLDQRRQSEQVDRPFEDEPQRRTAWSWPSAWPTSRRSTCRTTRPRLIAKLKSAGVTSVLFNGDPVAPQPLTVAATAQEYFPEWIMTGAALTDTSAFARTYDQKQWAHAFGVSFGCRPGRPEHERLAVPLRLVLRPRRRRPSTDGRDAR